MQRRRSPGSSLGDLEAEVMGVVWEVGPATVQDVVDRRRERKLAYTTIMTVMNRLVDKGYLGREKRGRAYVYRPLVAREQIAGSELRSVVDRFFDGLRSHAVDQLIGDEDALDDAELERLERLIRRRRKRAGR